MAEPMPFADLFSLLTRQAPIPPVGESRAVRLCRDDDPETDLAAFARRYLEIKEDHDGKTPRNPRHP